MSARRRGSQPDIRLGFKQSGFLFLDNSLIAH